MDVVFTLMNKSVKSISIIFCIVLIVILSSCSPNDNSTIEKDEAKVICINAFEAMAKYGGSDPSMLGTVAKKVNDSKFGDVWMVVVPGTMKNGFGADLRTTCYCKIATKRVEKQSFSPANIISIKCR
jgi:hypothetical protein